MALSTVSGILTRIGMGKLGRLGLEPAQRYEREGADEECGGSLDACALIGGVGPATTAAERPAENRSPRLVETRGRPAAR